MKTSITLREEATQASRALWMMTPSGSPIVRKPFLGHLAFIYFYFYFYFVDNYSTRCVVCVYSPCVRHGRGVIRLPSRGTPRPIFYCHPERVCKGATLPRVLSTDTRNLSSSRAHLARTTDDRRTVCRLCRRATPLDGRNCQPQPAVKRTHTPGWTCCVVPLTRGPGLYKERKATKGRVDINSKKNTQAIVCNI
jgi:hypothetical protein